MNANAEARIGETPTEPSAVLEIDGARAAVWWDNVAPLGSLKTGAIGRFNAGWKRLGGLSLGHMEPRSNTPHSVGTSKPTRISSLVDILRIQRSSDIHQHVRSGGVSPPSKRTAAMANSRSHRREHP